jgi:glutathione S-transferase
MNIPYYHPGQFLPPNPYALPPLVSAAPPRSPIFTATKPKLVYFSGRGRAEIIRLIFAAVGAEYEDHRFAPNADNDTNPSRLNDEFAEFKKSGISITGQVPYLEIDGLKLVQSMAIARYLAGRYDLIGNGSPLHRVQMDMIVDTVQDLYIKYSEALHEKDDTRKAALLKTFWDDTCVKYGEILEKFLDENEIKSGYFVGHRLSWADLVVFDAWSTISDANSEAVAPFVKLAAHVALVSGVPLIAAWLATRPMTPF